MGSRKGGVIIGVLVSQCLSVAALADDHQAPPAGLTAAQIVQKHVAARGGLKAWRQVQSMVWSGEMEVGYADSKARSAQYVSAHKPGKDKGKPAPIAESKKEEARKQAQVPFVLEMKRPGKSRLEIDFAGKTAVQVYDGTGGWLLRPFLNRDDWEPFSAEQAKSQQGKWEIEGPLMNSSAQGTKVALESVEKVDGQPAYKLKLTHKSGEVQHIWIDAKSFLDVKVEGTPRRMDGKLRTVWVSQRDFRSVQGVKVPFEQETAVDGYADTHKMFVRKVSLNPPVDDARFEKPKT